MKKVHLDYFKALLTKQLEELTKEGTPSIPDIQEGDGSYADPVEQAVFDQHLNLKIRIKDRESKLIKKIRDALARIDDGTYGICEICEEDISIERLKVRPVTTQCIECKQKGEHFERIMEHKSEPD